LDSAAEILERIRVLYNFKNLTDLSKNFQKTGNWAAQMGKRDSIPYQVCDLVRAEKGVSMDWLLYGVGEKEVSKPINQKELITNIKESFYECWDLDLIPNYPKESISAISILFCKNLGTMIDIEKDTVKSEHKKRAI
jgi:hypothetical protein